MLPGARRVRVVSKAVAWVVLGACVSQAGAGVSYVSGTVMYRHTFTSGGSFTTASDSSIPAESNLSSVGYTLNNTQSLAGSSSTAGKARIGFIANSTTASIALKPGTGVSQSDPSAMHSFSETRIDIQDATRLTWTATSPGFGPPSTRYVSVTFGGSVSAGGFARGRVNLAWYRNSISGANSLGSVSLDTGTISTAGVFSTTLTSSSSLSGSTLTTGTNILMIGTIIFQADNHSGPVDIIPIDSAFGYSNSGPVITYVAPPGVLGEWFNSGAWETNNLPSAAPGEVGDRAYFPNDQGFARQVILTAPIQLGVLESNGSNETRIEGSGSIRMQNAGSFPSMVWQRNINGEPTFFLGVPISLGSVDNEFLNDSQNPIVLAGGLSTMDLPNARLIKTGQGPLIIEGLQQHPLGLNLSAVAGATVLNADISGVSPTSRPIITVGTGSTSATVLLNVPQRLDQLTIGDNGTVRSQAPGKQASATSTLTMVTGGPGSAVLDLLDDGLAVRPGPGMPDPLDTIADLVAMGYNGGAWTGEGIVSSLAEVTSSGTAVGYGRVSAIGNPATFMGVIVGPNDVVMRYTLYGDTNLNGSVTIADFSRLAANFNASGRWTEGDFNFDNFVGIADFAALAANFNRALPSDLPGSRVPEPVAAPLLLISVGLGLGRGRHRSA